MPITPVTKLIMLERLPDVLVYRIASYTEPPELPILHSTHRNLSEARLVRLGLGHFLLHRLGIDKTSEIDRIGGLILEDCHCNQVFRPHVPRTHDAFSGFLIEISNILMAEGKDWRRGAFRYTITKIVRTLPHHETFDKLRRPQYWMDLRNNWESHQTDTAHCVFRVNRIKYRVLRNNYLTALALIY